MWDIDQLVKTDTSYKSINLFDLKWNLFNAVCCRANSGWTRAVRKVLCCIAKDKNEKRETKENLGIVYLSFSSFWLICENLWPIEGDVFAYRFVWYHVRAITMYKFYIIVKDTRKVKAKGLSWIGSKTDSFFHRFLFSFLNTLIHEDQLSAPRKHRNHLTNFRSFLFPLIISLLSLILRPSSTFFHFHMSTLTIQLLAFASSPNTTIEYY